MLWSIGDTAPPLVQTILDENGEPLRVDQGTVLCELVDAVGDLSGGGAAVTDAAEPGRVEYHPAATDTEVPVIWDVLWRVDLDGARRTIDGGLIEVVDPLDVAPLLASPEDLLALVPGASEQEVEQALRIASAAVLPWLAQPLPTPLPDRLRQGVALLAALWLDAPASSSDAIVSETLGDYSFKLAASAGDTRRDATRIEGYARRLLSPWLSSAPPGQGTLNTSARCAHTYPCLCEAPYPPAAPEPTGLASPRRPRLVRA